VKLDIVRCSDKSNHAGTSNNDMIIRLAHMYTHLGDDARSADVKERCPVCAMKTVEHAYMTSALALCTCTNRTL
jgi:hypothetical protein